MKLLPFDGEAERQLLATWVTNEKFRKAFSMDLALVQSAPLAEIAKAMATIHDAGLPVTEGAVLLDLQRSGRIDRAGGLAEVVSILNDTPTVADPWQIVDRLKRHAALQRLQSGLERALQVVQFEGDLDAAKESVAEALRDSVSSVGPKLATVQGAMMMALQSATTATADNSDVVCATGFDDLDDTLGKLRRKHVWVVGGVTNWGKTSWAVAIVDEAMAQGRKALIVGNEDADELYGRRLLARRSGVSATRLRDRNLTQEERGLAAAVVAQSRPDPYYLDAVGRNAEDVAADVASLCASEGIDMVVFDYMQKARSRKQHQDRRHELSYIRDLYGDTCKRANTVSFQLTQLTGTRDGERPSRENIRDCKDLAHGAEFVLFGWTNPEGKRMLFVDKAKDGTKGGDIELAWDGNSASFLSDRHVRSKFEPDFDDFGGRYGGE